METAHRPNSPHDGMTGPGLRVAVIGSGPSGFYAAEALLKGRSLPVRVDMFDRLPTPYGLVRGGVAPDHQKIKSVVQVYERVALQPGFRFFGNVRLGRDLRVDDLRLHYDQIVYAVGNESDRRLGVPGEDLGGSHSATEFVGWYNGHPDHRDRVFNLSAERAAVIGIGNVAMDVTRVLAQDPERLAGTDIADYALRSLRESRIREVYLLGRRGPAQAAYSPVEIAEIGELESADLIVDPKELELDDASKAATSDPAVKKNVDYVARAARRPAGSKPKKVLLRFCVSPVELIGTGGRVTALRVERNALVPDGKGGVRAKGAGSYETLPVGLVFRSVGYHGTALPGVPFDEKSGRIPNAEGRVLDACAGRLVDGEYVVGWAKRGPSGLIGTNRADSVATVQAMLQDAPRCRGRARSSDPEAVCALLRSRGVRAVSFADWKRLDRLELERGAASGKIREKFTRLEDMLLALDREADVPAG